MNLKRFALLWLSGGANFAVEEITTNDLEVAVASFRICVPQLDDTGYHKTRDGSWCIAEEFAAF